jgi:hypothetical protein
MLLQPFYLEPPDPPVIARPMNKNDRFAHARILSCGKLLQSHALWDMLAHNVTILQQNL